MGEQAVALAKAVGYDSRRHGRVRRRAGPLVLLPRDEHPPAGRASGHRDDHRHRPRRADDPRRRRREAARSRQADVKLNGWAVESRIYAEDPMRNFLPSTGRLVTYRPPQEGAADGVTVRNDTGVYEGGEISIYYDPMIAKLVTHAPTRAAGHRGAGARARRLRHRRHPPQHPVPLGPDAASALAARAALHRLHRRGIPARASRRRAGGRGGACAWRPSAPPSTTCSTSASAHISGQMRAASAVQLRARAGRAARVSERASRSRSRTSTAALPWCIDGQAVADVVSDWRPGQPVWTGTVGGEAIAVQVRPILNGVVLSHAGASREVRVYTRREAELAALMPEKAGGGYRQAAALPDAGPGEGDQRRRRARRSRPASRSASSRR